MKTSRFPMPGSMTALAWAATLCLSSAALAAEPALLKAATPAASQAAAKAPPGAGTAAKPAGARRATTGPGTQTEDDVYVGVTKAKKAASTRKRSAASGGDDDLDDLEVERLRATKR